MRRVVYFVASSLDGYIARRDGSIDWLFSGGDYGYTAFSKTIDTMLMGRATYEQVLTFGPYPHVDLDAFVFSRMRAGERDEHVRFVGDAPGAFVASLREQEGKDIWLVGGAGLTQSFLEAGLIDVFIVSVHPILLGDGIPLFPVHTRETSLTLERTEAFDDGLLQLTYVRRP